MKKTILSLLMLLCAPSLLALNGVCMKKDNNPKTYYDYKTPYFVQCFCNCADIMKQCIECGHDHAVKMKQYIVQQSESIIQQTGLYVLPRQHVGFALLAQRIIAQKLTKSVSTTE